MVTRRGRGKRPRSPHTAMTPLCLVASPKPECLKEENSFTPAKIWNTFTRQTFDYKKYLTPKPCRSRKGLAPTSCRLKPPANGLCREAISHGFQKALHSGFYKGKTVNTWVSTKCSYVNMNRCKSSAKQFSNISWTIKQKQTLIHKKIYSIQPKFYAEQIGIEAGFIPHVSIKC
jgi:hypothetical protein